LNGVREDKLPSKAVGDPVEMAKKMLAKCVPSPHSFIV
jgi:hypothetical protein